MYKKVILIVVGLLIVAVIAYAQGGFEGPGNDQMGPGGQPGMGQMMPGMPPGMGPGMPGMMPMGSPVMVVSGNFVYILRGDQLIKLDDDLKVVKQVMLPRPMPRGPQAPQGGANRLK